MTDTFEPITTQEQFNAMISKRLEKAESRIRAEYADYETLKTANAQLTADLDEIKNGKTELEATINTLTAENSGLKMENLKTKIGLEAGIPFEMLSRIAGNNEEELKADAANLAKFIGTTHSAPLRTNEQPPADEKMKALKDLRDGLFKND